MNSIAFALIDFAKLSFHVYKDKLETKKYLSGYINTDHILSPAELPHYLQHDGIYEVYLDQSIQNPAAIQDGSINYGFYASFYVKVEQSHITGAVIAIRGTDNIDNVEQDVASWWRSVLLDDHAKLPTTYNQLALAFYYKAHDFCREHDVPIDQIYVTGHSLGGALAALLPAHNDCPIRAITFNAPGIADMQQVKHAADWIINFRSAYDFVSAIDHAVGNVFAIHVPAEEARAKHAFEIEHEHKQEGWTRLNIIEDLVEIDDFILSVTAQHSMEHVYQVIEKACYSNAHREAYLDPFASFHYFEKQVILPSPMMSLYPGEAEDLLASR